MKRSIKKSVCVLLIFILCISSVGIVNAESNKLAEGIDKGDITIQWSHVYMLDIFLSVRNGRAACGSFVLGQTGTTRITASMNLSRKNANGSYTTVKTWSGYETTDDYLIFEEIYYVARGYTYRLTVTTTVYRNGSSETVSGYHEYYAE